MTHVPGRILALVVGLFITILVCVTVLISLGKDPGALIGVSASILIPSLISLVTLGQVADVKKTVGVVQTQTNGHLRAALAAAGVPPVADCPATGSAAVNILPIPEIPETPEAA